LSHLDCPQAAPALHPSFAAEAACDLTLASRAWVQLAKAPDGTGT